MDTKTAVSLTLNKSNLKFVEEKSANEKKSKSEIVDSILSDYQRYCLKKEIIAGFKAQTSKDTKEAMLGFEDYLELIEKSDEN